jgi:WD40 repeat protein
MDEIKYREFKMCRISVVLLIWASVYLGDIAGAQPAAIRPELEVQTGHQHQVADAVFSGDSRFIATTDIRGSIRIWDTATGKQFRALSGHGVRVSSVAFSPDSRWLASAAGGSARSSGPSNPQTLVKLWELGTGRELHRLTGHQDIVNDLAFSADGGLLATAGDEVRIWDTTSGRQTERIEGTSQTTLAFSPDGRILAIREPQRLRLWALGRGELAVFALGNFFGRRSVAFRGDGARLAVPDGDRLKIIDPTARTIIAEITVPPESQVLGFVDGHCVVRSRRAYEVWDISAGKQLRTLAPREGSLDGPYHALSRDWRRLAVLNRPELGSVTIRDIAWNRPPIELGDRIGAAGAVAFSPDGSLLATKSGERFWVWDLRTGEPRLHRRHSQADMLTFTGDGRGIISGDLLWNLIYWDVASGRERHRIALKRDDRSAVTHACSADGRWCVSGQPGRIDVWQVEDWRLFRTFHTGDIRGVTISDDGTWVGAARVPNDADLWHRESGQHRLLRGHSADISRVAFSPGGRLLASADFGGVVRLWEPGSGREMKVFDSGHADGITSLAFSPDGRTLASGGADNIIRLWDVGADRLTHVLKGHVDWVAKLAFSPNGNVLASGSGDGTTRLWNVERGIELALLTATNGEPEWLVATPEGLFDGSATLVGWRMRSSAYPHEHRFIDFVSRGLLAAVWRGENRRPNVNMQSLPVRPEVRIMRVSGMTVEQARVVLRIRVEGAASKLTLYQNLVPVAAKQAPHVPSEHAFEVDLVSGENEIRAVVVSPAGASSDAIRVIYAPPTPAKP